MASLTIPKNRNDENVDSEVDSLLQQANYIMSNPDEFLVEQPVEELV